MPPRNNRGQAPQQSVATRQQQQQQQQQAPPPPPPPQQQQQQQQQQPPIPQRGGAGGGGGYQQPHQHHIPPPNVPPNLHSFHHQHHQHYGGGGASGASSALPPPPPGGSNNNNWSNGNSNNTSYNDYGGGYNGGGNNNGPMMPPQDRGGYYNNNDGMNDGYQQPMMPPPPPPPPQQQHPSQQQQQHGSPYPQQPPSQQQQQGRRIRTPGPSPNNSMHPQKPQQGGGYYPNQMMGNAPPPPGPMYNNGPGAGGGSMRGSAPPPPHPAAQMDPSPGYSGGVGNMGGPLSPPMRTDSSSGYGMEMNNSPPPPPPPMQQQQQQGGNYRSPNSVMPQPPPQQQQGRGGGYSSNNTSYVGSPNHHQQQQGGSGGRNSGMMPPPGQQHMGGGEGYNNNNLGYYGSPDDMRGGSPSGNNMYPPPPPPMQQSGPMNPGMPMQSQQPMQQQHGGSGGRGMMNGGSGNMRGGNNNNNSGPMDWNTPPPMQQQQQPPSQGQFSGPGMPLSNMGSRSGGPHVPPPPGMQGPMMNRHPQGQQQGGGRGGPMMPQQPQQPGGGPLLPPPMPPLQQPMMNMQGGPMTGPHMGGGHMGIPQHRQMQQPQHPGGMMPPPMLPMDMYDPLSNVSPHPQAEPDIANIPRQSLNDFIRSRPLSKTAPLSEFLKDRCNSKTVGPLNIAIDANEMISMLQGRLQELDPLWFLHSPLPDLLTVLVNDNVKGMRALNLEPVWVFTGMGVGGDVEAFIASNEELVARDIVWRKLTEGELPLSNEVGSAFETFTAIREDILMAVQRFLRTQLNVSTITAPFLSWCQMAALHKEGEVQLLMGPSEMLMVPYNDMELIVNIDADTKMVTYYDRADVLRSLFPDYVGPEKGASLEAAGERFLDLGLLTATHPALSAGRASIAASTEELYAELSAKEPRYGTLAKYFEAVSSSTDRDGLSMVKHTKGRCFVRYSLVFSKRTPDSPLVYFRRVLDPSATDADITQNISSIFGNPAPLSLFFFQFTGLLSVSLMTIITQSYFRDELPVADSQDFHHHLDSLVSLRGQTVYQLICDIGSELYQSRMESLSWVRWFEEILTQVTKPSCVIYLDEWRIGEDPQCASLDENNLSEINITMVLSLNSHTMCVPAHEIVPVDGLEGPVLLYRGRAQTFLAILLKAFDFLGYFSHPNKASEEEEGSMMVMMQDGMQMMGEAPIGAVVTNYMGDLPEDMRYGQNGNMISMQEGQVGMMMVPNGGREDVAQDEDVAIMPEVTFANLLLHSLNHCALDFQGGLLCMMELVRLKVLTADPCRYIPTSMMGVNEIEVCDEENPEILLASRIACLLSIPYCKDIYSSNPPNFEWAPVYSRYLCSFSVIVRESIRHLRELMEVMSACVFLGGHSDCTLPDFASFAQYLPFNEVPSTIGGLLLHYVLVFPSDYENNCTTRKERCDHLQTKFKDIDHIPTQLRRVMEFTFQGLFLLKAYSENVLVQSDADADSLPADREKAEEMIHYCMDAICLLESKWTEHLDGPFPRDVFV